MVKLEGFKQLQATLNQLIREQRETHPSVIVGYEGVNYAVYVHENLEARHAPGTQAKYLEQPAREKQNVLAQIIVDAVRNGAPLLTALYLAGLRLQRESQLIVPIATGELRHSAFTRKE
jgi:hypothetical protein